MYSNWYKLSGKTYRDDKSNIILYHVSPNKLSHLQPLSKFGGYIGLFMSPSYRSIIDDWASYVKNKKHNPDVEVTWKETLREIEGLSLSGLSNDRVAKNPENQAKLDALLEKRKRIDDTLSKEEYEKGTKGYSTLYIHKIECPKAVYEEAKRIFHEVYESGYMKDSTGFWAWGEQIFIPKEYLKNLKIVDIETLSETQFKRKFIERDQNRARARQPSFKMTPKQIEEFNKKEEELKGLRENTVDAKNKNWYKK